MWLTRDERRLGILSCAFAGAFCLWIFVSDGLLMKLLFFGVIPLGLAVALMFFLPEWKETPKQRRRAGWAMVGESLAVMALAAAVRFLI